MIIFDLSYIRKNPYAGVSKYAYRILDYIVSIGKENDYVLIVNSVSKDFILKKYPQFKYHLIGNGLLSSIPILRTIWLSYEFKKTVNNSNAKVVFCPWANEITCLRNNKYSIGVIHDLQYLLDIHGLKRNIYKFIYNLVVKNSNKIVTISEFSRNQICQFYPSCGKKLVNLGNSVSMVIDDLPGRLINNPYILYVGRICEMKNVETLLKAFSLVHNSLSGMKLVLVGGKNKYWDDVLLPLAEKSGILDKIQVVSDCSEKVLSSLYRDAELFVFPSLREGFGFPPIEAALMSTPVITTKCDSLGEVSLGLLYTYNNPRDYKELANTIISVLDNPPTKTELDVIKQEFINHYSVNVVCKRIVEFLESAL